MKKILVIVVTHNSYKFLDWCAQPIIDNKYCDLSIVDSGSDDKDYLEKYKGCANVYIEENIGFAKANNRALNNLDRYEYVLFLNPDARIESNEIDILIDEVDRKNNDGFSYFSVPLISYDFDSGVERGFYDSLGIKSTWYGKWYDVREPLHIDLKKVNDSKVYCGAFFLVSTKALRSATNNKGSIGFEDYLYMYKEDIELSLRLKKKGYKGCLIKNVKANHCRGWDNVRSKVPFWAKYYSARNDIFNARKYNFFALPYSLLKFAYVMLWERK